MDTGKTIQGRRVWVAWHSDSWGDSDWVFVDKPPLVPKGPPAEGSLFLGWPKESNLGYMFTDSNPSHRVWSDKEWLMTDDRWPERLQQWIDKAPPKSYKEVCEMVISGWND